MTLTPKRPPGRPNRKALAFASETGRLHLLGYSAEAVRQILSNAGLIVSRCTVTREVARHWKHPRVAAMTRAPIGNVVPSLPLSTPSADAASLAPPGDRRTGKQIAADFMDRHVSNRLLRDRSNHESSRH